MEAIELDGNPNNSSQNHAVNTRSEPVSNHSERKSIEQRISALWQQYISPELIIEGENGENYPVRDFLGSSSPKLLN